MAKLPIFFPKHSFRSLVVQLVYKYFCTLDFAVGIFKVSAKNNVGRVTGNRTLFLALSNDEINIVLS